MSPDAARLLLRLARLVRLQWGQSRRVVVEEAWDEPDEIHPFGRHGNQSLHYEGRALLLSLGSETTTEELQRLAQLAICAGFPYADVTSSFVAICTAANQSEKSTRHRRSVNVSPDIHEQRFRKLIQSIDAASLPAPQQLPPPLDVGGSHPPGRTPAQVLGPPLSADLGPRQEQLFQYTYPDVDFPPEGDASSSCQEPPRPCQTSCLRSESAQSWDWCRHRAMTPRAALRLRRLAVLVQQRAAGTKIEVANIGSQDEVKSGRALNITLPQDSSLDGADLSSLAKQAGFDYLSRTSPTSLQVYVKRQEGYRARLVSYQSSSLLAVQSPSADFDLPPRGTSAASPVAMETEEEVPLVDGHDRSLPLSAHFRVDDFAHPDHRFFRLEPLLLHCLELSTQELGGAPPRVEAAYHPASVHRVNWASRPRQEKEGFRQGRAVLLKPPASGDGTQEQLWKMAAAVLSRCTPLLVRLHRKLGLGCHGDGLYVDVRARTSGDAAQERYAEVWDVDNPRLYGRLTRAADQMTRGGPVIDPTSEERACREPPLGEDLAYFSFSTSPLCVDFKDPCQERPHRQRREEVADKVARDLITVLARVVPPSTVSEAVKECLVTHCGGCLGAGRVWKKKVRACVKLVKLFSEHAPSPWGGGGGRGGAAFLNSHAPQSSLHGLACQQEELCLENMQLYSLVLPALQARYRPDPKKSREELLYSGEDNASPLLEVIQQEMAASVQGKVKVYIEREGDLGVLKDTLKVLMVHNKEVTEVEFHFLDAELRDRVLPRLQRHLEGWALRACPRWSRFAVAPFSLHLVPPSRRRRSVELGRERNQARLALQNWELDWLQRI